MFKIYSLLFRNFSLISQFRFLHEHQLDSHGLTQFRFLYKHQLDSHGLIVGSWRNCIRLKILEILTRRSSFARGYKLYSWRLLRYRPAS